MAVGQVSQPDSNPLIGARMPLPQSGWDSKFFVFYACFALSFYMSARIFIVPNYPHQDRGDSICTNFGFGLESQE